MFNEQELEALRQQTRNKISKDGGSEMIQEIKRIAQKIKPLAGMVGINAEKIRSVEEGLEKLSGNDIYNFLSSDNVKKHSGDTAQLFNLLKSKENQ